MELSNALYNDLAKADKKGTISDVETTETELANYYEIQSRIEKKKSKFTETYKSKILDEIGGKLYTGIKSELKKNNDLKARYEEIIAGLKKGSGSEGIDSE